jgi:hypothetical protein
MPVVIDSIFLNKRGDLSDTSKWAYYRVTSHGKVGDNVEVCLLKWPTFEDLDVVGDHLKAVVVNPGDTGFTCAFPNLCSLLKNKWNIDHDIDDLIGLRERRTEF